MTEILNAKITGTKLGVEDHGIPTAYIDCETERGTQGFGGYDLRTGNAMCRFVMGVQKVLGADDWSKVKGSYCRIKREDGLITAIGHIVENRWFNHTEIYDK